MTTKSTNSPLMDEFLANLERTLCTLDSERRSEMIKKRMSQCAEAGYSMQRPPLGYSTSPTKGLYVKNTDAYAMKYYFNKAIYGVLTANELRYALTKIYSETNSISKKRLLKLVSNPYYIGLVSYGGQLFQGLHEPLLTKEEQDKLARLLS